ncbi:MAG: hypothetical protein PHX51_02480 [Clostridia bacterium]|nr:hypothetical protein [Clostridia bacterium]
MEFENKTAIKIADDSANQQFEPTLNIEVDSMAPTISKGDEMLDMNDEFDINDFQVVRKEFFAHLREPSVTFNDCKFYVNAACLSKFQKSDFAQILVNRSHKILALLPCEENARDSFMWCNTANGKKKPRPITCKLFFAKIFSLMDWNPKYRYKLLGKLIHSKGKYMIAFDLNATEVYQKSFVDGEKPKISRTPVFPAEWQNQFGLPFNEHKQSMQINIFDGYAIYSIKDITQTENNHDTATEPESKLSAVACTGDEQ